MEGIANPAFESDQLSETDVNANESFSNNNETHPNSNDGYSNTLHVATPDPPDQQHYSTLGHPVRHLLKVDKICNSAPCTLDKKALKVKQSDHNAPMYIITEPWVTNSSIFVQNHQILPSPTLRAHELGILATPVVLHGVPCPGTCKSKVMSAEGHTGGIHTVNGLESDDMQTHLDTISLRYHNIGRRKSRMDRRRVWSRRLLILSVVLVICLILVIIVIVLTWQMIDQEHASGTTPSTETTTEAV